MKRILVLLTVFMALLIAGCGGTTPVTHKVHPGPTITAPTKTVRVCSGLTDTCATITVPKTPLPSAGVIPGGPKFPDVSSYQGHPNWAATKAAGYVGGIFKGGEYVQDPTAVYNNASLQALHMFRAMYWFVRNTGCSHVASQIITLAHTLGIVVVVNDLEVPAAAGYGACLVPAEKRAGLIPVDYTAPGTFPGGGFGLAPLWQATYNFSTTVSPFWKPMVAWQFTDSHFGPPYYVSGVGYGDVSVDYGLTKLVPQPAPPGPSKTQIAHWTGAKKASEHVFLSHSCGNSPRSPFCFVFVHRTLYFEQKLNQKAGQPWPICFGSHARLGYNFCKVVRPTVSAWSHAQNASKRVNSTRARYFQDKIDEVVFNSHRKADQIG